MRALIQLATPETIPVITHLKICNWTFEVPRPIFEKDGYVDIWLAKCYLENDNYYEIEIPGINIRIEGEYFDQLKNLPTTIKPLMEDSTEILSQFLIDCGYFEGIVVLKSGN